MNWLKDKKKKEEKNSKLVWDQKKYQIYSNTPLYLQIQIEMNISLASWQFLKSTDGDYFYQYQFREVLQLNTVFNFTYQ